MNPNQDSGGVELKPCPFCGKAGELCKDEFENAKLHWVRCFGCDLLTPTFNAKDKAVKWWNKRPPAPTCGEGVATSFEQWWKKRLDIIRRDSPCFHPTAGEEQFVEEAWTAAQAAQAQEVVELRVANMDLARQVLKLQGREMDDSDHSIGQSKNIRALRQEIEALKAQLQYQDEATCRLADATAALKAKIKELNQKIYDYVEVWEEDYTDLDEDADMKREIAWDDLWDVAYQFKHGTKAKGENL